MRQEKRDEKRLNKERKLEQRRLELEIARELKKPNEDMCLADHKVFTHCGAAGNNASPCMSPWIGSICVVNMCVKRLDFPPAQGFFSNMKNLSV